MRVHGTSAGRSECLASSLVWVSPCHDLVPLALTQVDSRISCTWVLLLEDLRLEWLLVYSSLRHGGMVHLYHRHLARN